MKKNEFLSGRIKLHKGPMFSGKTSALMSDIYKYKGLGMKCVIIKLSTDTRYSKSKELCTHSHKKHKADLVEKYGLDIDIYKEYDVIGIDEGQFFCDLVDFCDKLADMGKIVIVSALSSTFERKAWDNISELSAKTDEEIVHYAYCQLCMNKGIEKKAPFSAKKTKSKKLVDIGGKNKYIPVCRQCFEN